MGDNLVLLDQKYQEDLKDEKHQSTTVQYYQVLININRIDKVENTVIYLLI